jgi:hypothetical protein
MAADRVMGRNSLANRRASSRRKTWIAAASFGAHLVLIAALALSIRAVPPASETPTMVVSLLPRLVPPPAPPHTAPRPAKPHAAPVPRPAAPSPPAAPPLRLTPSPPPKAPPPSDAQATEGAAVRGALRDIFQCPHSDTFKMDAAERERCRKVSHELGQGAQAYVMDPEAQIRHGPPVASHGWKGTMGPPPPRPGVMSTPSNCGPMGCPTPEHGPP